MRKTCNFFIIQNKLHWHTYRLLYCHTVSEKAVKNSTFWAFFNSAVTTSWISATSAKLSLCNFIFNLGNRKYSDRVSHSTAHVICFPFPRRNLLVPGAVTYFPFRVSPIQLANCRTQGVRGRTIVYLFSGSNMDKHKHFDRRSERTVWDIQLRLGSQHATFKS